MSRSMVVVFLPLLLLSSVLRAQTTYHLHTEASSTPGLLQLKQAGPDHAGVAYQSANLQGADTGIYLIKEFDTQAGDPGVTGAILSGTQITFTMWMRKTASLGSVYPAVDLYRNSLTDQPICSTQALAFPLTTIVTQYTFSCTTTADVNLTPSDRIYLAMKVDLLGGSSSGPFAGELDIEGTTGGATDSRFTIPAFNTAPKISGLSPTSGPSGSAVFVSGGNFGVTQAGSTIKIGSTTVTPRSWRNSLINFLVPSTASTGNVVVTVGGVASNAKQFKVTPGISNLSPNKGPTGASVTINGTKFGTTAGSVKFNGVGASVTSWTNTKIVATVPATATTGPVVVTAGTLSSNLVPFNVNSCTVSSISISPPSFNLVVGQGHSLKVSNNCGQAVSGATWTTADPNTAYVSTNTPSELIAENAGSTTLTATYQGSMAQATVTVYSGSALPLGTTVWSPETSTGYTQLSTIPGAPTANNAPAFFFVETDSNQQTLVHGVATDGTTAWVTPGGVCSFCSMVLTDDGGIVVSAGGGSGGITTKIDGSGNQVWSYQPDAFFSVAAVAENGTIYGFDGGLLAVDGSTGIPKARSPLPTFGTVTGVGPISIMPNGTAYMVAYVDQQVWLVGLTSNGVPSQQVIGQSALFIDSVVIPDGNGGVLVVWSNGMNTVAFDIGGSANGTYSTLGPAQQAILGDTGAAYLLGRHTPTSNASILAISTSTGSSLWQWDFPAGHSGSLIAPQAGGGVVAVDGTYDQFGNIVQQNVVRFDTNGIPTYDSWSAGPGSLSYYRDGIWINGHAQFNPIAESLGPVSATAVAVADTDWINPNGNERKQQRPKAKVKFQENTTCSAVDDTINPAWIMVPMSGSNGGAKVNIRGDRQDVQFVSEDPTIATVTPAAPTGGNTPITVSGLKSGQITTIDARSISDPTHNYAQLKVVVKPQLLKIVDMYKIIESVDNLTPQTMPTASALQAYLNINATAKNTWGKQANISFTVNPPVNISVHYDLLPLPSGGDGFLNDFFVVGATHQEDLAIQQAVLNVNPSAGQGNRLEASYINAFGPGLNHVWVGNHHLEGLTLHATNPPFAVSFIEDTPSGGPSNSRLTISAHELGHGMGANDTDAEGANKNLMWRTLGDDDPLDPCEIRRVDWGKVNPTPGDDGTQ